MTATFSQGFVLFCEDVRTEEHGKRSFMGNFFDVMYIGPSFPATLPKFCVVVSYIEAIDVPHTKVNVVMRVPGVEQPVFSVDLPMDEVAAKASGKTSKIGRASCRER